jgi:hypothetical protein
MNVIKQRFCLVPAVIHLTCLLHEFNSFLVLNGFFPFLSLSLFSFKLVVTLGFFIFHFIFNYVVFKAWVDPSIGREEVGN